MARVRIVEVGPRDGLQNISSIVSTDVKIELIKRLSDAGLSIIEITSFVSPKWVPQLADGEKVLKGISQLMDTTSKTKQFPVLIPNVRGLEKAHKSGAKDVAVFISATEAFSKKNINCSVDESLIRLREVIDKAKQLGIRVRGYVSCIFADPYEGPTNPLAVVKVTQALLDAGCYEVSLGDTVGVGTPTDVERLLNEMLKSVPEDRLACHFHDTYGQAVANVVKAYSMGISTFDSSVAGLGGCPFAKGAKGNLSTEDLLYTLEKMGIQTGVNLDKVVATGVWISQQLRIPNGSRAGEALAAKSKPQMDISAAPIRSKRKWSVLESTSEYQVSRSGVNLNICLTRPQNGNALSLAMMKALTQLFQQYSKDDTIFRIILSAKGRYFCTGMDLKGPGTSKERFDCLKELFHAIDACTKTTIAAINGPCFGGGVGLAFVCDLRIATSNATFKLSEVRLGLCPATISKYVIREWGFSFARSAFLTAREVKPQELVAAQVVQKIVADQAALVSELDSMLDKMRYVASRASALSKKLVHTAWVDAGGEEQDRVIESSFREMMAEGSESVHANQEFRKGIKAVDWEALSQGLLKSKL